MDELDNIFLSFVGQDAPNWPVIACLFTGKEFPPNCCAMPRDPLPPLGSILSTVFPSVVQQVARLNASTHDGAIMLRRECEDNSYVVVGWSFRLFPPPGRAPAESNRGSAFNSCIAMSEIPTVDRIYLVSSAGVHRFESGLAKALWARETTDSITQIG